MKNKNISFYKIICTIIPAVFFASPLWISIDIFSVILSACCVAFKTIILQIFFDTITQVINGSSSINYLIILALATGGIQILGEILNGICNFTWFPLGLRITGEFNRRIHKKVSRLEAISFEAPDTLDLITKAKQGVIDSNGLYNSLSSILAFYLPYFIVIGLYLYKLRPLLAVSIFVIFIPLVITQVIRANIFSELIDDTTPIKRKMEYYQNTICDREYFKETRILGIYSFLKELFQDALNIFIKKTWKASKRVEVIELSMRLFTLLGYLFVTYILFISLIDKNITIGTFAAVYASIDLMIRYMNDVVSNYFGRMMGSIGSLRSYVQFLNLHENTNKKKCPKFDKSIKLSNVTFLYPNTDKKVLDNITLDITPGETIAIVGENGAGKTTLVRLITGILKPTDGQVLIDGIPTSEIESDEIFRRTSGVLQKFQKYKMTLKENITISKLDNKIDSNKINISMSLADVEIDKRFTHGLDTVLSREFEGVDLSGGEWQRIALARGLYKEHDLIVLDEPTSAIDPVEETRIYKKFAEISKGKTTIIVTHRLGSTKLADRIIVVNNGKIDAIGNHEELMEQDGIYANMYRSQAKWYKENNDV
ncbi:MAG: ABC transporter ATP-binding protein/permease [Clostridia bacterium]|nr:ABC transporter ATP-binding protein/permease [Clostridia bacterium]